LNRSSNKPNGTPAHIGNSPGRTIRHDRKMIKPSGGTMGKAVAIIKTGSIEASRMLVQGTA
jgi:hypothetical protein